jgi:hypothetical protein
MEMLFFEIKFFPPLFFYTRLRSDNTRTIEPVPPIA